MQGVDLAAGVGLGVERFDGMEAFFVTGQIYVDRAAPNQIRGQAQGFLVLITQGLGMLIGAQVFGEIFKKYSPADAALPPEWKTVWLIPCIAAAAIALIFFVFFREDKQAAANDQVGDIRGPVEPVLADGLRH